MSFFYIRQPGQDKIPLWNYTIVSEFGIQDTSNSTAAAANSTLNSNSHQLRSPAQIATSSDGLLYVTNDKDGEIIVADEKTLQLKGVKCLAPTTNTTVRSTPQWLNIPTSIGSSDTLSSSVVILPTTRLQDSCNLHTLTANVNGSFLKVSSANLGHWNACSVCFGPEGKLLIGNSRYNKVYTYNMITGFVGDMEVDCKPSCLAYDHSRGRLHVCDSSANIVKVFSEVGGRPIFEYGRKTLVVPKQISIDAASCSYVVCSFNLSCFLAIFDPNGEHIFNVYGFEGPSGVAVSHDQSSVWVSDIKKNCLVKFEGLCTLRPPFPISLFCQKSILLHMNELSLSGLPLKLSSVFNTWNQPVKVHITKGPSQPSNTMTLILKHGLKTEIIKWIICKRLNLPEQVKMSFRIRKGTGMTFVTQLAHYMDSLTVVILSSPKPTTKSTVTTKSVVVKKK